MADEPIEALGNKTPLAYAATPEMDKLSKKSEIGMVHTIPEGMKPGSDTANLSVLGYDPAIYYSGRSPLEALSIGVPMQETDISTSKTKPMACIWTFPGQLLRMVRMYSSTKETNLMHRNGSLSGRNLSRRNT